MQHKSWVYALVNDTINSCSCQYFKSSLCCQDLSYMGGKHAQLCIYSLILAPVQLSRVAHLLSIPHDNVYSTAHGLFHSTMSISQHNAYSAGRLRSYLVRNTTSTTRTCTYQNLNEIQHRPVEIMRLTKNSSQKFLIRYLYTPIIVSI